ncbi:MAG: cytochrome c3 family protein [Thermodesulfobacteriota bacterium]
MKIFYYSLIMISAFFIIIHPTFSQYESIELYIYSDDFNKHTRPLVEFSHMVHDECLDCMDCMACHHDYDESGKNIGGNGGFCSDCHTKNAGDNPIPLMEAFHTLCKQCHAEEIEKHENKNIPQMCGQCHVKKRE